MLRVWNPAWVLRFTRQGLVSASVIASFAVMLLALPAVRWLNLEHWVRCPFHALTGWPCPTCGYMRVYWLVVAGDGWQAMRFQPFIPVIVFLSALAAALAGISLAQGRELDLPKRLSQSIWGVLVASWAWNIVYNI